MTNVRVRAFLLALCLHLIFAITTSQQTFSQVTQTAAPPPSQELATAGDKAPAAGDETCEQSPAAAARRASVELFDASKHTSLSSQPPAFVAPRESEFDAARPFAFKATNKFAAKPFSNHASSGGQQTTAATYTPLTPDEKMRRSFKSAFLSVEAYAVPFLSAVITEAGEDDLPHKDTEDRLADGLSRFAIQYGRRSTAVILSNGVYASVFKQDPRYERADKSKGFGARALHAASRVFITRGDNGKHQPNYSRFAGQLSASALSNLWEQSTPGHDRIGVDATFRRFGTSFITGAVLNVVREFFRK